MSSQLYRFKGIDRLTGIYWKDYSKFVMKIYPKAYYEELIMDDKWVYYINTGEIPRQGSVFWEINPDAHYLGVGRKWAISAWKSAYLELKKLGAYE